MPRFVVIMATAALTAACADRVVVNTGESPPTEPPAAQPPPPPGGDPRLANAYDYFVTANGHEGYYFTTPSGKWSCAILPHSMAGCQTATGAAGMGITGEPETVHDADGNPVAPNAITVGDEGESGFAWLADPGFVLVSGEAKVLQFNETLAAAGFRCNVQEAAGVSCMREGSSMGFTFSTEGWTPQYTPVPG